MRTVDLEKVDALIDGLAAQGIYFFNPDATLFTTTSTLTASCSASAITGAVYTAITSSYLSAATMKTKLRSYIDYLHATP